MTILLQILFWFSVFIIFHSYVLYPLIVLLLSRKKRKSFLSFEKKSDDLPKVSILLSIYNEEVVIAEKIESILNSDYPYKKIELLIGSDNSTDNSNEIVEKYCEKHSFIKFFPFYDRQGKPGVINQLQKKSSGEILILTDANVIFEKDTIFEIVRYFKNTEIGLIDTRMINKGLINTGISIQESAYISREVKIKNAESKIWGTMMGPFGGCFAIKSELYEPVPSNFLVDDFFINMLILEKGYDAINNIKAIVYEDVSNNINDEFRRKIRIATGNFQNLKKFGHLLLGILGIKSSKLSTSNKKRTFGLAFSFLSHKVLRWIIPFFIIIIFFTNIFLIISDNTIFTKFLYIFTFSGLILSFIIPIFDLILKKLNINFNIFRFITHFYGMNLALLIGFFRYNKGVKSGIWQPTKRNQTVK